MDWTYNTAGKLTADAYTILINALPKYKVGNGFYLRDGDTYSVLGVLCEIAEVPVNIQPPRQIDRPTAAEKPYLGVWTFDGEICVLTESVAAWSGVTDRGFALSKAFERGNLEDYERL